MYPFSAGTCLLAVSV